MADYSLKGDRLIQGKDCFVRAGNSAADAQIIGFSQDYSIRVQVQTQKAEVLGHFLPVSIDPTGVSVSTSFRGFIPKKGISIDGSELSTKNFAPTTSAIVDGEKVIKIPYLELYDKRNKTIICSTTWAILTSYDESAQGKGYVTANCSFESIGFENGTDWATTDLYTNE